jgi:hypothetical protein
MEDEDEDEDEERVRRMVKTADPTCAAAAAAISKGFERGRCWFRSLLTERVIAAERGQPINVEIGQSAASLLYAGGLKKTLAAQPLHLSTAGSSALPCAAGIHDPVTDDCIATFQLCTPLVGWSE